MDCYIANPLNLKGYFSNNFIKTDSQTVNICAPNISVQTQLKLHIKRGYTHGINKENYNRRFIVKKQRPVNLDLTTIKLPSAGKASILHRATGVAMFFALIFVVWAWATSVGSAEGFSLVQEVMGGIIGYTIALGTLSALTFHFIGGIRHVVMDMGYWEELKSGNNSANIAMGLWIFVTVILGVVLW